MAGAEIPSNADEIRQLRAQLDSVIEHRLAIAEREPAELDIGGALDPLLLRYAIEEAALIIALAIRETAAEAP